MKPDTLYYVSNERRGGLPDILLAGESRPKVSAELVLDYGWITEEGDRIEVEHKTLDDLAQSLRSRHLDDQLERAKQVTPHIYLLVTGMPTPQDFGTASPLMGLLCSSTIPVSGNWTYHDFISAVTSKVHGLQIGGPIYCCCLRATAANLLILFKQTRRAVLGSGRPVLPKWKPTKRKDQAESYNRAIPNVGWQRAIVLAEAAPTWADLVGLLEKGGPGSLKRLRGFGPILSARIYDEVMKGVR